MKFKDLFSVTQNTNTKQYIFSLKIKKLRKLGITPEQLLALTPEQLRKLLSLNPKTKFHKK